MYYTPSTTKENGKFYGVVKFTNGPLILNDPKETRAKALTTAKNKIKELNLYGYEL